MTRTCIIGGAGFIGRYLVNSLSLTGREIIVVGRNPVSPFDKTISYLHNEKNSPDFWQKIIKNVDEVIEMAYSSIPQTSFQDPVRDIFDNLAFSVRIFEALLNSNVQKVLYVSSGGTIYGQSTYSPINEGHPTDPVSPYGITKLAIEKYGLMYRFTNNFPIVIVRPGNAYGVGQLPFRGQGFISTAIATILNGEKVKIFGEEGTIRDYIHVEDVASGIIAALEYGKIGECYNIGTGMGRSNREIIRMLEPLLEAAGYTSAYEFLPARAFDVRQNILDSVKLTAASGWKPEVDFNSGLAHTVEWLISNRESMLKKVP